MMAMEKPKHIQNDFDAVKEKFEKSHCRYTYRGKKGDLVPRFKYVHYHENICYDYSETQTVGLFCYITYNVWCEKKGEVISKQFIKEWIRCPAILHCETFEEACSKLSSF
jgi:hypothetical protein